MRLRLILLALLAAVPVWTEAMTRVDVMVVYTPAVTVYRNGHDNVFAHILNSIALTNVAMENSEVPIYLNLVHVQEIDYEETTSMSTDLGRLRSTSDGFMDEVHAWRNQHGADLVCLMRRGNSGNTAGIAYQLSNLNGSPTWAFSVVSDISAASTLLMGHELGHNFGAAHDHNNTTAGGILSDSFGHRFVGTNGTTYRTVMAYSPGTRVAHYSNPDVSFAGTPTGAPATAAQPANNARGLRRTAAVVAGYRAEVHPGPDHIFNGPHVIQSETRTFGSGFYVGFGQGIGGSLRLNNSSFTTTEGFRLGQGENSTAELFLFNSSVTSSGANALLAASPGSSAVVTIAPGSTLNFSSGSTFDRIGHAGSATVHVAPGATLTTRHAILGDLPGSSGAIHLSGDDSVWNHASWYVDIGRGGNGLVTALNGARLTGVQRLHVGGSSLDLETNTGVGTLTVSGPTSSVSFAATSSLSYLAVGRQGAGTVNISNGATMTVTSSSTSTGYIELGQNAGDSGTLNLSGGGKVSTTTFLRAGIGGSSGERPAAAGAVDVTGTGSELTVAGHVHLGFNGIGSLALRDGGQMSSGSNFFIGRSTGTGLALITGADSRLSVNDRLLLAADPNRNATTAIARLEVEADAEVIVTNDVVLRGGGEIHLRDGGLLHTGGQIDATGAARLHVNGGILSVTGPLDLAPAQIVWTEGEIRGFSAITGVTAIPAAASLVLAQLNATVSAPAGQAISLAPGASITGSGRILSRVNLGENGRLAGTTGSPLRVMAGLDGSGAISSALLGGEIAPSPGGTLTLSDTRFAAGLRLLLQINDTTTYSQVELLEEVDSSSAVLEIAFVNFVPSPSATFPLLLGVGENAGEILFADIIAPEGWILVDGVLRSTAPTFTFSDWLDRRGLSGAQAEPDADSTGNGFTNLQEYAFGIDPARPDDRLVEMHRDSASLTLRWRQLAGETFQYRIEHSLNLSQWETIADAVPAIAPASDGDAAYEEAEWTVPVTTTPRFYRIRATPRDANTSVY